jgi:DHA2 family multidrug resistance protein
MADNKDIDKAYSNTATSAHHPIPMDGTKRILLTISIMVTTVMQTLDNTVANVALPQMKGTLSATQDQMVWILTTYIVAAAIMTPLTGWLAGHFGRKKVFMISIIGFTISSALCGMAVNLPEIVLFRLLQGMSGAALVPLSQAVLFDINKKENYGKAMALWGMGVTLGPILGPALGGWLTETYNWRWVFYINVPIGIAAFLGLWATMPETKKNASRFDFFGFIALSLTVGALQLLLDRGQLKDWFGSNEIIIYALTMSTAFYLFLVHTITYKNPFVNPALFKNRNFFAGNILIFVVGIVMFAILALLPPMLQNNMNYPVITTGLITAPRGIGAMLGMIIVGQLTEKIDPRLLMGVGLGLTAFSLWQMTQFSLLMDERLIIISGILQGIGIGLTYVPLAALTFATLPAELRDEGTAFFNLLRNIGSAVGISVVQTLLTRNTQILHAQFSENITPYNLNGLAQSTLHINPSNPAGLVILDGTLTNQVAMIAYINDYKLIMIMTIAVIPLLLLFRRPAATAEKSTLTAAME